MSVEFEPVKLGPRRRRVDPVAIGALIVAIGVVAAVLKPWSAGTASSPASTAPGQTAASSTRAAGPLRISRSVGAASEVSWDRVRAAVRPHDDWGIRAIVARTPARLAAAGDPRFDEVWSAIPDGVAGLPTVDFEPNDQAVIAIGVTFPAAHTPIDARIWLVHPDRLEWIDTQALDPSPSGGGFLYRVTNRDGSPSDWAAGRYRIDVLVDGAVSRAGFTLPNRFGIVPDGAEPPLEQAGLIDPTGGALPDLPIGLFVLAGGVSIPLPADEGPSLTEAGAWLNVDPGTGRAPRSYVATAFVPAATGLGVMLPPGSVVARSGVRRLAPEPLDAEPEPAQDDAAAARQAAHVLYRAPGGGAWTPGVYRVSVTWADPAGLHDRSWHVELRPGPVRQLPSMLLAARGFARYAGSSGVVVGTAEPLGGGPGPVAIRLLRAGRQGAIGMPARDRVPCDGVRIDGLPGVVGLAGPPDAPPSHVVVRALFEFSRSDEQPMLVAAGDVPGLTLLARAADAPMTSVPYRSRIGDATIPVRSTVCISLMPAG